MQLDISGMVTTDLSDTLVFFDGAPAPVLYTSSDQVNAVVPVGLSANPTQVQVEYAGTVSDPFSVPVAASSPGVFSANGTGTGQGDIFNQDGSANSAVNPALPGSVITLYLTGAGQLSPAVDAGSVITGDSIPVLSLPVSAQIGGQPVDVVYAGGDDGLIEGMVRIQVQVPQTIATGPGIPILVQVGDQPSQAGLTVAIENAEVPQSIHHLRK
jgi:uncharacterized protein (TIGR03437 family)